MRRLLISCFVGLVLLFTFRSLTFAQDHVKSLLGVMGGYNLVSYRTDAFPTLDLEPTDFMAQNGRGKDIFWGVSYEDPLTSDMHHFLILKLGYNEMSGDFSIVGDKNAVRFSGSNIDGTPDTGYIVGTGLQAHLSYLNLNVGYKFNLKADSIPDGLGIQLCFEFGLKMGQTFIKSVTASFSSPDTTQTIIADAAIGSASALRLALRPEITYDIPFLNNRFVLTPFVGFDAPLTQVDQAENWTASAWFGGIYLRYAFW